MSRNTIRSIVVGTDLSDGSDAAVRAAGLLATRTGAALHAVHVPETIGAHLAAASISPGVYEARTAEAEREMEAQLRRTLPAGVAAATRDFGVGGISDAILLRAAAVSADLIVLGRHRGRGLDRLLGGTAEAVASAADAPCLVVNGRLSLPVRRVGVAVDLADPVVEAVELATRWAELLGASPREGAPPGEPGADVVAVHVGEPVDLRDTSGRAQRQRAELQSLAADGHQRAGGTARVQVHAQVLPGQDVAQTLGTFSGELGVLVVSARGRRGLKRVARGSTTAGVLRTAQCPLLVLPPALRRNGEGPPADAPDASHPGFAAAAGAAHAAATHPAGGSADLDQRARQSARGVDGNMAAGRPLPPSLVHGLLAAAACAALVVAFIWSGASARLPLAFTAMFLVLHLGWRIFGRLRR